MHDKYAEDHPLKDTFIEELKPFYVNLRDQIVNPNGSLYELKKNSIPWARKKRKTYWSDIVRRVYAGYP